MEQEGMQLAKLRPRHLAVAARAALKTLKLRREHRYYAKVHSSDRFLQLRDLGDRVFDELSSDPQFYKRFDAADDSALT